MICLLVSIIENPQLILNSSLSTLLEKIDVIVFLESSSRILVPIVFLDIKIIYMPVRVK